MVIFLYDLYIFYITYKLEKLTLLGTEEKKKQTNLIKLFYLLSQDQI